MKLSSLLVYSTSFGLLTGCGGKSSSEQRGENGDGGSSAARGGSSTTGGTSSSRGGGSPGGTGGATASGTGGHSACTDAIVTNPINDYTFSSILRFRPIPVRPGVELTFDWSRVTNDLLRHPIDLLSEIDFVDVAVWNMTPDELATDIRGGWLQAEDISGIMWFDPGHSRTEASLFEFGAPDPIAPDEILPYFDVERFPPDETTYTVMLRTGDQPGWGYRMIQAFTLDPASTATTVELTNDSTAIEISVDLSSHQRTAIPAGRADVTIDWSDLDENAIGLDASPELITEVVVARYDESTAELEEQFFDLELIAEDLWRAEVEAMREMPESMSIELSSLTNAAGERFTGIDGNGTWLVALLCGECQNPAPWYLSVLVPCPAGQ